MIMIMIIMMMQMMMMISSSGHWPIDSGLPTTQPCISPCYTCLANSPERLWSDISDTEYIFFLNSPFTPLAYFRYAFEHKKHGWSFVKFFIMKWMKGQSGKKRGLRFYLHLIHNELETGERAAKDASNDELATKYANSILNYRQVNSGWLWPIV